MRLRNLIQEIDYIELVNVESQGVEIKNISYNSKKARPGDLFVCLSGEHVDGHEFAEEALEISAREVQLIENKTEV